MIDAPKKKSTFGENGENPIEDDRFRVDNYMPQNMAQYWDYIYGEPEKKLEP